MDVLEEQASGPSALPPTPTTGARTPGRHICPYLVVEGGGWRSAHPSRDHRCGAIVPPALLAPEKQRRLCLAAEHRTCATWAAARELDGGGAGDAPTDPGDSEAPVTRWALVRTTPVVLDQMRVPVGLGRFTRDRRTPQLALGGLLVVAFLVVALGRLPGGTSPAVADADPSPSTPSSAASSTPRPTARATPSARPSVAPTPTASAAPSPSATPRPSPTPRPTQAATRTYTVKAGDTLYAIAIRYRTTVRAIQDLNGLGNSSALQIGQVLRLP